MFSIVNEASPETIIHYAEQPSAPYSMKGFREARDTLKNNLDVTFNCIWAVKEIVPAAHIVKLGTMGEYGTPNIDIEEGWLEVNHNGRQENFYPRAAGSLYHTTKVLDTDLLWFYVRTHNLRVTDLIRGPVYGLVTKESSINQRLMPNFHYDDIFGTVVNRFLVQAVSDVPLTVYGQGGQTRGYLNLNDTLQCVELATSKSSTVWRTKNIQPTDRDFYSFGTCRKCKKCSTSIWLVSANKINRESGEKNVKTITITLNTQGF